MEDKELQQLIDAKLWQLENQRQQEEIASRIGRKKTVWPWWLGTAAAAAILAAVLLSPVLFGGKEDTLPLIADASSPQSEEPASAVPSLQGGGRGWGDTHECQQTIFPSPTPSSGRGRLTQNILHTPPFDTTSKETIAISSPDSTPAVTPTTPRVHTRRSNRLGDIKNAPEKPQVPALIAHYINIPDTVLFTSNIVINLK